MPRVSCIVCGARAAHRHHVCYRQWQRDMLEVDINHPDNLVPLCLSCHGRHHNGHLKIPVSRLPVAAIRFAVTNGMEHRLRRQYDYDIEEAA